MAALQNRSAQNRSAQNRSAQNCSAQNRSAQNKQIDPGAGHSGFDFFGGSAQNGSPSESLHVEYP